MKYLFDNSLPSSIASGFREFGKDVRHVADVAELGREAKDPAILKYCGQHHRILVCEDKRIRYNPSEIAAIRRYRVGAFILLGKDMGGWDRVLQIVKAWQEMDRKAAKEPRPFIFKVRRGGTVKKSPESL